MPRVDDIVGILERRILQGDYLAKNLPGEARLAQEVGTSRKTARKAFQRLIEKGYLVRRSNGRVKVQRMSDTGAEPRRLQVALLVPAYASLNHTRYRLAVDAVARRLGGAVRAFDFNHWDDVVLSEVLQGRYDGTFFVPWGEEIPAGVVTKLRRAKTPLFILEYDLSHVGIPSLDLCPVRFFQRLLDRFADLGHRRVDCLNTQPIGPVMRKRIEQWNLWRAARGFEGELYNEAVQPFHDPMLRAYQVVKELLAKGEFDAPALFCTTSPAANGAIRALYEAGLQVGRDVSVSGANDEGDAWVQRPSLTTVRPPDPEPYLAVAMEWMARGGREWSGPLLMEATDMPLFSGESVGPAKP